MSSESKYPAGDVRALFDKANVPGGRYRTFTAPKAPAAAEKETMRAVVADAPAIQHPVAASDPRRTLHSLFEVNSKLRLDVSRGRLSPGSGATIGFSSCAGGVGKTTLSATVARILSSRLANVMLADRSTDSVLPYFFGLDRQGAGSLQTVFPTARRTGYQMTLVVAPCVYPPHAPTVEWLQKLQGESALTLMDIPTFQGAGAGQVLDRVSRIVVPLLPDVQSIASISRVEEISQKLDGSQDQQSAALFVLNRFDDSKPMHREIRAHLEKLLGSRLAPIAVRESDHVPEALSVGMTVIDHSPHAPIAQDFELLVEWLEDQLAGADAQSARNVEIA